MKFIIFILADIAIVSAVGHYGTPAQAWIAAAILARWEFGRIE